MAGTWKHSNGSVLFFNGTGVGRLTEPSINYGPRAQRITEFSIKTCTSSSISYNLTGAQLVNTVDPSFQYDKHTGDAGFDWSKVYSVNYSISGSSMTFGGGAYAKQ